MRPNNFSNNNQNIVVLGFRDSKYLLTMDLIAICLDIHSYNHSYYKFTTSLLTVLDLFCLVSSSLSLI
jgi:hypothetical protein